jgi:hypothetical protein
MGNTLPRAMGIRFSLLAPDADIRRITDTRAYMLRETNGASMSFTVIWYGRLGIVDKAVFDTEKTAKDHAVSTFQARKCDDGVISVEVRKDNGAVVFSYAEN